MTYEEFLEKMKNLPGNAEEYDVSHVQKEESVLNGKTFLYLGSSVTFGACSMEQSFVEILHRKHGVNYVKEAVSGTTLVNDKNDGSSYVERMLTMDSAVKADAFICQLSTNDATKKKTPGTLSEGPDYDVTTIAGAMEYIITYARKTWNCPVFFYTGSYYDSKEYQVMVDLLKEIQKKHGIQVINLWDNPELAKVSKEDYAVYMADPIHPTKAGYLKWWTPEMEKDLIRFFTK